MNNTRLPRVVWLLGLVSLCMDFSSEMIHALLPVFLVSTLGASTVTLGLIEGVAEGTASIAKVFSGVLSDRFGRRKPLVVLGYGLAALSKPLFPLANSAGWVLVARFADRIGKGIRGAPRDALLADATSPEVRGAAFGLRQALDTAGALLRAAGRDRTDELCSRETCEPFFGSPSYRPSWPWWRSSSAWRNRHGTPLNAAQSTLPSWRDVRALGRPFWIVVVIGTLFTLARFSEAFLVVRANDIGLSLTWTPLALAVMNFTYVVSAYPVGRLSDRIGREGLLLIGMVILIVADIVLITATQS